MSARYRETVRRAREEEAQRGAHAQRRVVIIDDARSRPGQMRHHAAATLPPKMRPRFASPPPAPGGYARELFAPAPVDAQHQPVPPPPPPQQQQAFYTHAQTGVQYTTMNVQSQPFHPRSDHSRKRRLLQGATSAPPPRAPSPPPAKRSRAQDDAGGGGRGADQAEPITPPAHKPADTSTLPRPHRASASPPPPPPPPLPFDFGQLRSVASDNDAMYTTGAARAYAHPPVARGALVVVCATRTQIGGATMMHLAHDAAQSMAPCDGVFVFTPELQCADDYNEQWEVEVTRFCTAGNHAVRYFCEWHCQWARQEDCPNSCSCQDLRVVAEGNRLFVIDNVCEALYPATMRSIVRWLPAVLSAGATVLMRVDAEAIGAHAAAPLTQRLMRTCDVLMAPWLSRGGRAALYRGAFADATDHTYEHVRDQLRRCAALNARASSTVADGTPRIACWTRHDIVARNAAARYYAPAAIAANGDGQTEKEDDDAAAVEASAAHSDDDGEQSDDAAQSAGGGGGGDAGGEGMDIIDDVLQGAYDDDDDDDDAS